MNGEKPEKIYESGWCNQQTGEKKTSVSRLPITTRSWRLTLEQQMGKQWEAMGPNPTGQSSRHIKRSAAGKAWDSNHCHDQVCTVDMKCSWLIWAKNLGESSYCKIWGSSVPAFSPWISSGSSPWPPVAFAPGSSNLQTSFMNIFLDSKKISDYNSRNWHDVSSSFKVSPSQLESLVLTLSATFSLCFTARRARCATWSSRNSSFCSNKAVRRSRASAAVIRPLKPEDRLSGWGHPKKPPMKCYHVWGACWSGWVLGNNVFLAHIQCGTGNNAKFA